MPRKDSITGCQVLTVGEFLTQEAEHEGKGRTGGDILREIFDEIHADEDRRVKELTSSPEQAMHVLNEYIVENDWDKTTGTDNSDLNEFRFAVVSVLRVYDAEAHYGMRQSSEGFTAECVCSDGKSRTLLYRASHDSGTRIDPPDSETSVYIVLQARPVAIDNCPGCGALNYNARTRTIFSSDYGVSNDIEPGTTCTCGCGVAWKTPGKEEPNAHQEET